MEFTTEFITEQGFTPEQVIAIKGQYDPHIVDLKGEWDGKANEGAQGIIDGAIAGTQKKTGFALDRNQGEKNEDFLLRYTTSYLDTKLTSEKSAMEQSKIDYENKVESFKGDETLKGEYDALKLNFSELQKKEASFDELTGAGYESKYNDLLSESNTMREDIAFGTAKPSFHKDIDDRIVNHEWKNFVAGVKETHNIVIVDGEGIAIDKTNEHKRFSLKDLVKGNEELTKLVNGRTQDPLNANSADFTDVDGLPFRVPQNADRAELAKLVQEQLTKDGIAPTHPEHSEKFQAMYDKAKAGQQTA